MIKVFCCKYICQQSFVQIFKYTMMQTFLATQAQFHASDYNL